MAWNMLTFLRILPDTQAFLLEGYQVSVYLQYGNTHCYWTFTYWAELTHSPEDGRKEGHEDAASARWNNFHGNW